jgi:hypothetical protein
LAERYSERRNEIHVHLTFCDREYCAVFYRPLMDKAFSQTCAGKCGEINGCGDQVEVSMLLNIPRRLRSPRKWFVQWVLVLL